ncbi:flagellar biosynthesis protein FlaG [Zobellella endophytica]|uniref:Flagellar biosynthesis protein FlaG n=1 Tax=Zobellella endophytica TaxID=2116700 RepID=A0A2P7R7T1_9GAMM|nr:flagellar protein FlaG [Zobellella endophytica]PSJ46275.1 flagellar biosynthesis protein FlaG [Zobellella endophytica]
MDTQSLTQKPLSLAGEAGQKQVLTAVQARGTEATQTAQAVQAADKATPPELSHEQLEEMAGQMESFIGSFNRGLKFRVDEDSGRQVVTVVDNNSGDVIRQIPSEELLEVVTRLAEATGGLIDVKV